MCCDGRCRRRRRSRLPSRPSALPSQQGRPAAPPVAEAQQAQHEAARPFLPGERSKVIALPASFIAFADSQLLLHARSWAACTPGGAGRAYCPSLLFHCLSHQHLSLACWCFASAGSRVAALPMPDTVKLQALNAVLAGCLSAPWRSSGFNGWVAALQGKISWTGSCTCVQHAHMGGCHNATRRQQHRLCAACQPDPTCT